MRGSLAFFCALVLGFATTVSYASQTFGEGGDTLPWPWGSECPFPWHQIEGLWEQQDPKIEGYQGTLFEFKIIEVWESGTHVFQVNQYDGNGNLVAAGKGVSPGGQRIVRAMLLPTDQSEDDRSHFVIVRAYTEGRFNCSDRLITVLTMREQGASTEEDVHMVIRKREPERF